MATVSLRRPAGVSRAARLIAALGLAVLAAACAQTRSAGPEVTLKPHEGPLSVLLMPADVELSLLTTGGMLEPNAEWTEQGRQNVIAALNEELAERSIEIVAYGDHSDGSYQIAADDEQLVKLHQQVGSTIMLHRYVPGQALPTKKDSFDWTLGNGVQALRDAHGADYALFIHARDSFASAGRVALNVVTAILFRSAGQGGRQVAFASLVDLESGDVVWFNVLQSGGGDLRDPKLARQSVDQLLDSSPL
jgi:hypothetical protein